MKDEAGDTRRNRGRGSRDSTRTDLSRLFMDGKCTVSWVLKRLNCPRILRQRAAQLVSKAEILLAHHKTIKQAAGGPFLLFPVQFSSVLHLGHRALRFKLRPSNAISEFDEFRGARATSIPRRTTRQRNRIDSLLRTPRRPSFQSLLMDFVLISCWCPTMSNSNGAYLASHKIVMLHICCNASCTRKLQHNGTRGCKKFYFNNIIYFILFRSKKNWQPCYYIWILNLPTKKMITKIVINIYPCRGYSNFSRKFTKETFTTLSLSAAIHVVTKRTRRECVDGY